MPSHQRARRNRAPQRLAELPAPVRAAIGAAFHVDGWHACPGGCGATVSPGHVACQSCWLRVPRRARRPLVEAFRNRARNFAAYQTAVDQAARLVQQHSPHTGGEEPTEWTR